MPALASEVTMITAAPPSLPGMARLQSAAVAFAPAQRAAYLPRPHGNSALFCSPGMALTTAWARPTVGATPSLPITGGCVLLRYTGAHSHGREARSCCSAWSTLPSAASGWFGRRAVWPRGTMSDAKWGAGSKSAVRCRVVLRDQLLREVWRGAGSRSAVGCRIILRDQLLREVWRCGSAKVSKCKDVRVWKCGGVMV